MKKTNLLSALLLLLTFQANAVIVSLDGEQADGENFNILSLTNANMNEVVDISFNFIYEALSPSWGGELIVEVGHLDSDTFFQIGTDDISCSDFGVTCEFNLDWANESGIYTANGVISLLPGEIMDGSGEWEILIGDSFDDAGVDGQFLSGSFVQINQMAQVSTPATFALVMLALSLFAARKKLA